MLAVHRRSTSDSLGAVGEAPPAPSRKRRGHSACSTLLHRLGRQQVTNELNRRFWWQRSRPTVPSSGDFPVTIVLTRIVTRALLVVSATLAGCGSGMATAPTSVAMTDAAAAGNYLPLAVGMSWTYNITSTSGTTGQGTTSVEANDTAPMAGLPAMRVRSGLLDGNTLSWEQTSGSTIVRVEEQQLDQSGSVVVDKQYMPAIIVLDESPAHLTAGATWTEDYKQLKTPSTKGKATKEEAQWTVESIDDMVTVPAGTYSCIRVRRVHSTSKTPSNTVSWYAAGIGRVRETGAGANNDQTLELASTSMQ